METMLIETSTKQYPLYIGENIRFEIGTLLGTLLKTQVTSILIITDEKVAPLYLEDIKNSLSAFNKVFEYIIPSGEASKSFQMFYDIQGFALEKGLDRRSLIIALGGGVVGDLAGFVAATFMRGIPFVQVPTTLLAHDSSVGGKVAINHPLGKNMIGAFYQPEAVIYDTKTLQSLPEHEWRSGFAEVLKHGFIWDEQFLLWLKENIHSFSQIKGPLAEELLVRSISVKKAVVKEDETEKGIRAFLNFGHTLAHAIETKLGYGKITHGEAVVIGMVFALKVSEDHYKIDLNVPSIINWFKKYKYDVSLPSELVVSELIETMKKDKKSEEGIVRMVLLNEIGKVEVVSVSEDRLKILLSDFDTL
ncbi:3-dehydroquinate synthase [Anaerobacillus isosaccharinicus]|uniref:3-dehydroquinate synthase n=1 Tax=Anaerobacillus isosaccharinicus TaxID=1532552 RepID=A0A1S2KVU9_9BACI|nr:3-dehydroquinate synthase [Anaerobacillus isosaccharinicus]MBA5585859.1 3-dehydroquinate synthase [Anaerobacillus isosaccharinicus]QOY35848.1 3-dehydroquinate synthase [Anaerobacillus isosaccharinicus]